MKKAGQRIRELRRQKGLTQEQLAEVLNISQENLARIERGTQGASIDLLIDMACFFTASLDYLILGHEMQIEKTKKGISDVILQLMELQNSL